MTRKERSEPDLIVVPSTRNRDEFEWILSAFRHLLALGDWHKFVSSSRDL